MGSELLIAAIMEAIYSASGGNPLMRNCQAYSFEWGWLPGVVSAALHAYLGLDLGAGVQSARALQQQVAAQLFSAHIQPSSQSGSLDEYVVMEAGATGLMSMAGDWVEPLLGICPGRGSGWADTTTRGS